MKYEMLTEVARPNVAVRILERDDNGDLHGEYKGYYNFRKHTFTLYPSYNRYAIRNGHLTKKTIPADEVRYYGERKR